MVLFTLLAFPGYRLSSTKYLLAGLRSRYEQRVPSASVQTTDGDGKFKGKFLLCLIKHHCDDTYVGV
jgi:hypothetical protein